MRKVLLVAFHFPPLAGSSGLQRTLRFAQYLPEFGWEPIVLTVQEWVYRTASKGRPADVPPCEVVRTMCLDASRHLSLMGRYPTRAALPDRWASWQLSAVRAGLKVCRTRNVNAIWSTYPIATAHLIGARLATRSGLPWIADFRDPMAQEGYPSDPRQWKAFEQIEKRAAGEASRLVFVSPSALDTYRKRYPKTPDERFVLIENGFDETSFEGLPPAENARARTPLILHSGIVYPSERDPRALFTALGRLRDSGRIAPGDFVIRFRAPVHMNLLRELSATCQLGDFVQIEPPIPYRDALSEMLSADALLLMQGTNCNAQVPAKLYEYLRAQRPILALTDPVGDTGRTLQNLGYPMITPLESAGAIEESLPRFVQALRAGTLPVAPRSSIDRYSRRTLTARLATTLNVVSAEPATSAITHTPPRRAC